MANDTTATTPTSPTTGIDYADYQKKLQAAAAQTRDVQGVSPETWESLQSSVSQLGADPSSKTATYEAGLGGTGEALLGNLATQEADLGKRAESAASALEIAGGSALTGVQNLESIQQSLRSSAGKAMDAFGQAAEKADEYVQAARSRVQEVLGKVDSIYEEINKSNDFSKAHDMQAAVQSSLGSMRAEERNIAEVYGKESPEYQQFKMQKSSALAGLQSNIHSTYAKLRDQMSTTYLGATVDAYTASNTAVSYQEQQHVEMLKYKAEAESAYQLNVSQLDITLEQMKTAGLENLANWILETPTFSMDSTGVVTALSDLLITQETNRQAAALNAAQQDLLGAQAGQTRAQTKQTTAQTNLLNTQAAKTPARSYGSSFGIYGK